GEPFGVVPDLGLRDVDHLAGLVQVRPSVRLDLLGGEHRPGLRSSRWVADPWGEVSDDQHRHVSRVLELAQLSQDHGVTERQIGATGVDAQLHAKGSCGGELLLEPPLGPDLGRPAGQQRERVRGHGDRMLPAQMHGSRGRRGYTRPTMTTGRGRALAAAILLLAALLVGCGGLPRLEDYPTLALAQTSFLYASDGSLIAELHADQDRVVLTFHQMPQSIRDATVAIEDRRFYQHHGVDLRAILRAAYDNLAAGRMIEGGSTITESLVENLLMGVERTVRR